jgi:hypothetical protein
VSVSSRCERREKTDTGPAGGDSMSDWSRRSLLRAGAGVGVAVAAGGGWYLTEQPFCRPPVDPW